MRLLLARGAHGDDVTINFIQLGPSVHNQIIMIMYYVQHGIQKQVAVKVFLQDISAIMEHSTIPELLALSQEPRHLLFAYKEIRQEVSFLSALNNPFLTGKLIV